MYAYLNGTLADVGPTHAVIDVNGVAYLLSISLNTYEKIQNEKQAKLFTYLWVKDDALSLFGFADKDEQSIFELMISVSGVGPNTARTILSTLTANEAVDAISQGNVSLLKSVKGIGAKTAQRMVLELQDKVVKTSGAEGFLGISAAQAQKEEALSALVMLGFAKNTADKALDKILKQNKGQELSVEQLIKLTLKSI